MAYKYFDKTSTSLADKSTVASGIANNKTKQTIQLAKELHKPITRNFKKRTVYSGFKDIIWGADLADMQLISKFNKVFRFLLCVIDIFSKYAWCVPLKDKKGARVLDAFQEILKNLIENQTKYVLTKEVNFTITLSKNG